MVVSADKPSMAVDPPLTRWIDLPEEHSKFIEDSKRLAEDISGNQTFNTVKPLLNFWAAFSPSKEVRFES